MGSGTALLSVLFIACLCSADTRGVDVHGTLSHEDATLSASTATLHKAPTEGTGVCLDGSAPAFYYRPPPAGAQARFIVWFEGGGWCYNETSCYNRSYTGLGSSKSYPPTTNPPNDGMLSNQHQVNAHFWDWGLYLFKYCDGASFSGNQQLPVNVQGWNGTRLLYFQGYHIMEKLFKLADTKFKLNQATDILVTGSSAGGLAAILHVDYVAKRYPAAKVIGISDAGFFLDGLTLSGEYYARSLYRYEYHMQQANTTTNAACDLSLNDWRCYMAQYSFPYIKSPFFVINAIYDTYQLENIFAPPWLPGNEAAGPCMKKNGNDCSANSIKLYNEKWRSQVSAVTATIAKSYFLHSCWCHVQAIGPQWNSFKIGTRTMQQAVRSWLIGKYNETRFLAAPWPSLSNYSCGSPDGGN